MAEPEVPKKYEQLYELTRQEMADEVQRFTRVDEKASRYLSVMSLLLVIFGLVAKPVGEVADRLAGPAFWSLVGGSLVFMMATTGSLWLLFSSLRFQNLLRVPMSEKLVQFFDKESRLDILYALSRSNIQATLNNRLVTEEKILNVTWASRLMMVSILCLVVLSFLIFFAVLAKWV